MNTWSMLIIFILAMVCPIGCDTQTDSTATDLHRPNPRSHHTGTTTIRMLEPIDGTPTLTKDSLQAIEQKYSCQLPDDYRRFLLESNGAYPSPACVTFEDSGRKTVSDVFCFFAISDERAWASMEWHYEIFSGRLPKNTLPIARDSAGNLWLLSVRSDNAGSIFFWDHGSFDTFDETDLTSWPLVATSFHSFRDSLGMFDASAADDAVPSRYSLVKQATDSMVKKDISFSTRANPDFVWHCHCDEDGDLSMQFVRYKIHAAVTHTCGYSRLRAIKGLIKGGQTRLPE